MLLVPYIAYLVINTQHMHTRIIVVCVCVSVSVCVCVCVCVCSQSVTCVGHFYSIWQSDFRKLLTVCNLQICLKWSTSRDTTLSRLLAYKSAILSIWQRSRGAWLHCGGRSSTLLGTPASSKWSALDATRQF